jgi:transcriptional regulator with XRE-family HTH domain
MQDIADKAGVSRVTVSRVLSNHPSVKAETRKKVLYWVKALDYEPNLIAQGLAGNRTNIIGLLAPEIAYPFFSEIIEAIENQAFYEGYSTIICNTRRSLEKEKISWRSCASGRWTASSRCRSPRRRACLPAFAGAGGDDYQTHGGVQLCVHLPLCRRPADGQTLFECGISKDRLYRPH